MQTTQRKQLKLIESFFTEELNYRNDYVSYITVGGNSSVTPKNNNNENSLNFKIAVLKKAKTKFDISYSLNLFEPGRHFDLLMDLYSKKDFLDLKEEFLNKYEVLS